MVGFFLDLNNKFMKKDIEISFDITQRMVYRSNIETLDIYQDGLKVVYKKSEIIKLEEFLNTLPL